MTCYQIHSHNIFSHVRSANRCFEGVTHSSCFENKKLERECLAVFALCLLRKEGRPAKGHVQIFLKRGPTVSRNTKLYLLLPLSLSFTLDSAWVHKKPAFYWSKSQMSLCCYAKRLQVYGNLKSIQSLCWTLLISSESRRKIMYQKLGRTYLFSTLHHETLWADRFTWETE